MSIAIDEKAFARRWGQLADAIGSGALGGGAGVLAVATGKSADELTYLKSAALQIWLFGFEFTDTVFLFTKDALHVVATSKKAGMFDALRATEEGSAACANIVSHVRAKADDGAEQIKAAVAALGIGGDTTVAVIAKEAPEGAPAGAWAAALKEAGSATADAAEGIAGLLAVKDAAEILNCKKSAHLAATVLKDFVVPELETVMDSGKEVKHSALSDMTEQTILTPSKIKLKLREDKCEIAYPPIFQSGGKYSFKYSSISDETPLNSGVIVTMLGTRYSMYCTNLARTYMVDPSKPQERAYKALLKAQTAAIKAVRPGAKASDVYAAASAALAEADPELVPKMSKNAGFGLGLDFRDGTLALNAKNEREIKEGMVFNVTVSLSDLSNPTAQDPSARTYALVIGDSVVARKTEEGNEPEVITSRAGKEWKDVAYELSEEEAAPARQAAAPQGPSVIKDTQLRSEAPGERQRLESQQALLDAKNQETFNRLNKANAAKGKEEERKLSKADKVAYRRVADIPCKSELELQVDARNAAVLLPIRGLLVPFHITTVKNVTVHTEGQGAYIHLQFNVPGSAFGTQYLPAQKYPNLTFLREATFRSTDARHANQLMQHVKTLRKQVLDREKEKTERENLVTQETLKVSTGRLFRLPDLYIKPTFGGRGRRSSGTLEAHSNGFRYRNPKGEVCDVIYSNIKHAFFQAAEKEAVVILHFRLHNPIIINKKKTEDVQFYREVVDMSQALDGRRTNAYDPDEIDEEQRDRQKRNRANKEFQEFTRRVQELWERTRKNLELEFDIPYKELAFQGVPYKESVNVMPSVGCLVSLVEQPFFVLTLDEVEIVNLERVGFGLKNFDMTIVFKDFSKDVHRVDAIPTTSLESIKEWLNGMGIKYYESKMNLAWKPILKTIVDDPQKFIEEGGWNFLDMEAGSSDEEDEEEESEGYEPEESEPESEEGDESDFDEDEEDESDFDDDYEEGEDWDELEEQARKEDRERGLDDGGGGRKRKAGGPAIVSKKSRR